MKQPTALVYPITLSDNFWLFSDLCLSKYDHSQKTSGNDNVAIGRFYLALHVHRDTKYARRAYKNHATLPRTHYNATTLQVQGKPHDGQNKKTCIGEYLVKKHLRFDKTFQKIRMDPLHVICLQP